jgi:DNA-binding NarL/FixJ family response regulator
MGSLRILIADDHDLIRRGLKALLEPRGWTICAEAHTGREAVEQATELTPEIAVLDISMPELNGIEAARKIRKASPNTEILMLSVHYSDQLVRDVVKAGVRGYVEKSDSERDLVTAVEALANHESFFTTRATELVLSLKSSSTRPDYSFLQIIPTPREREVIKLISEGKSSQAAAILLGISTKTAEKHRSNVMRKLKIHNVSELVRYAVRNRIIEP